MLQFPSVVMETIRLGVIDPPTAPVSAAAFPWFALYVKSRHEKHVALHLERRGYEGLVPLYLKRTPHRVTELPLFPGYVFSRFDVNKRLPVMSVPGVFDLVKSGTTPVPIPEQEIFNLQKMVQSNLPREPHPYPEVGQKVVITSGSMRGVEGTFIGTKSRGTLIVSVHVLRRSVAVEVDGVAMSWPPASRPLLKTTLT